MTSRSGYLVLLLVLVCSCTAANPEFVEFGLSPDLSGPGDMSQPPPPADMPAVSCGGRTCQPGQACCVTAGAGGPAFTCQSSCGDGGLQVGCGGPEDCGGSTPYCCAHVSFGAGSLPDCPVLSDAVSCQQQCDGALKLSCPSMATLRACKTGSDCANDPGGFTSCCDLATGTFSARLCVNELVKLFLDPQCF